MKSFAMNERIDDLYLRLLTKLPFPTGSLKDIVKEILMLLQGNANVNLDFLEMSKY